MKIKKTGPGSKIGKGIAIIIALYILMCFWVGLPCPRGFRVDNNYYSYYKNIFGIYYISVEFAPALLEYGQWGYLEDVDEKSFKVLSSRWAKDNNHVWYLDQTVKDVDVKSFHINESGVAVDRNSVYIRDISPTTTECFIRPAQSGIDVGTAEYFVHRLGHLQDEWMRDKNYVYYYDNKIDVDRNSFRIIGKNWFVDKDFLYKTSFDRRTHRWDLHRIDSLQNPIEPGDDYFRNGRNIIYCDSIILKDIDVKRFEEIGIDKYRINNMLFLRGKPFLKDSLDVENARFYHYGHIAADNENVYYVRTLLDDIDASTFRQIDDNTFEDKDYIYTMKDRAWGEEYPFIKKGK